MTSTSIIIFGATGDLARRKLFPTLYGMRCDGFLTSEHRVIAIGRRPFTSEQFRDEIRATVRDHPQFNQAICLTFEEQISYFRLDFHDESAYSNLRTYLSKLEISPANHIYYLAAPPESYPDILRFLKEYQFSIEKDGSWNLIVVEKPFGHDLASAQTLNQQIHQGFGEEKVFRIDHYLGKETVQNILSFRFANGVFEPLWNAEHIAHIQITVAEEEGIGTRGNYYDRTGAIRDVLQNHLIQLLAVLTIEEPTTFSHQALSDQKVKIITHLQPDLSRTVIGQYEGYQGESKVSPNSQTETYAMTTLHIDSDRWRGVPIYVRTGKRLRRRISEISVQFKTPPQHLFQFRNPEKQANILTFRIQPDEGIGLQFGVKTPRESLQVESLLMEFCYGQAFRMRLPDAYERLFADMLKGEKTLALRDDTVEESWRVVDRILAHRPKLSLYSYQPGSWGPEAADQIISQDGHGWYAHESQVCNAIVLDRSVP